MKNLTLGAFINAMILTILIVCFIGVLYLYGGIVLVLPIVIGMCIFLGISNAMSARERKERALANKRSRKHYYNR